MDVAVAVGGADPDIVAIAMLPGAGESKLAP
jgi:hypothetical protein